MASPCRHTMILEPMRTQIALLQLNPAAYAFYSYRKRDGKQNSGRDTHQYDATATIVMTGEP